MASKLTGLVLHNTVKHRDSSACNITQQITMLMVMPPSKAPQRGGGGEGVEVEVLRCRERRPVPALLRAVKCIVTCRVPAVEQLTAMYCQLA